MNSRYFQPMAGLGSTKNPFGIKTEQALVRDVVVVEASRDPYADILRACERMASNKVPNYLSASPRQHDMDIDNNGGLLPAI